MKNIKEVVNNGKCSSCSACYNICPTGAISMIKNSEGFLNPQIDNEKCINCGLCDKVCPSLNQVSNEGQNRIPNIYAGWNKDEKIRLKSSSGGVFSVLAEYFLDKKGYVCGASFNDNAQLKHIIISKKRDLKKLRSSKYLQSEIGNVYKEIRKLLINNKWVLFSGTPCQAAGLRSFLNKKYEKLLIVDIVCHGTPSPDVLKKYLKDIEKERDAKIKGINFRDKSTGWKSYSFTLSGDKEEILKEQFSENIFFKGFLNNLYLNKICTNCPYSKFPKYSDITLGDYWGIWDYSAKLDDKRGVSVIIINNTKGQKYLSLVKEKLFLKKIDEENAIKKLKSISLPCNSHVNRKYFFEDLIESKESIGSIIEKNLKSNISRGEKNVAILNMRFPTNNIGAILQSYALSNLVKNLGYHVEVINYTSRELEEEIDHFSILKLDKFRENNISYTLPCYTDSDLIKLNKDFDTFIVGSDQVWNYNYLKWAYKDDIAKYFLNFAFPSKKLISYAASFAEDHWDGEESEIKVVKNSLQLFSSISVREKSGIKICKDLFEVKAEYVLDPTLLLESSHYEDIINTENFDTNKKKYVAYFTLDSNLEDRINQSEYLIKFGRENNLEIKNIRGNIERVFEENKFIYNSIPAWLNYIKNSDFLITDSYHCVIFAILFKKQFICIGREYAGNERLKSLFSILGIKNRFLASIDEVDLMKIQKEALDYSQIYSRLERGRAKSFNFLKQSLEKEFEMNDNVNILEEKLLEEKLINQELKAEIQIKEQEQLRQEEMNDNEVRELKEKYLILEAELEKLNTLIQSLLHSKTFRYAEKLKKILFKLGFKRFKV